MGVRRLTKLNEFNISFSTALNGLLWWWLLSEANQAMLKHRVCRQNLCVCVLLYSKVTWWDGRGITGFKSNWGREDSLKAFMNMILFHGNFARQTESLGPMSFEKPFAKHDYIPMGSIWLGPIFHCRNQRGKSVGLWAEQGKQEGLII